MEKKRAFYLKLFCVPSLCGSVNQPYVHIANLMFLTCIFKYADPVADLLDRWGVFRARLFRESCVFHRGNYVKDLSRLGRELSKVIIVDNSPASYIFHPENAVSIQGAGVTPSPGPCPGFGIQKMGFSELARGRFCCLLRLQVGSGVHCQVGKDMGTVILTDVTAMTALCSELGLLAAGPAVLRNTRWCGT